MILASSSSVRPMQVLPTIPELGEPLTPDALASLRVASPSSATSSPSAVVFHFMDDPVDLSTLDFNKPIQEWVTEVMAQFPIPVPAEKYAITKEALLPLVETQLQSLTATVWYKKQVAEGFSGQPEAKVCRQRAYYLALYEFANQSYAAAHKAFQAPDAPEEEASDLSGNWKPILDWLKENATEDIQYLATAQQVSIASDQLGKAGLSQLLFNRDSKILEDAQSFRIAAIYQFIKAIDKSELPEACFGMALLCEKTVCHHRLFAGRDQSLDDTIEALDQPLYKLKLYLFAARQGHVRSQESLGNTYLKLRIESESFPPEISALTNANEVANHLKQATDAGSASAAYLLARFYEHNLIETASNAERVLRTEEFLVQAGDRGDATAQREAGVLYCDAAAKAPKQHKAENLQKAVYWLSRAAMQKDMAAIMDLYYLDVGLQIEINDHQVYISDPPTSRSCCVVQ